MNEIPHYAIRGGAAGRERLRVMSRVLSNDTEALLDRAGVKEGMRVLDVGCGGGDVSTALARRVGPHGHVVGLDMDANKIEIARQEAEAAAITNVDFVVGDARDRYGDALFDVVYARFLLTHLPDPGETVGRFPGWLRPGGVTVIEDIDFAGCFVFPDLHAFRRYHDLYCEVVRRRGGDPNIGPRLPALLRQAGFVDIDVGVTQPTGLAGEVKLLHAITLENIADAIVQISLAPREELDILIDELYAFGSAPDTLVATPRIVQVWGRRPG